MTRRLIIQYKISTIEDLVFFNIVEQTAGLGIRNSIKFTENEKAFLWTAPDGTKVQIESCDTPALEELQDRYNMRYYLFVRGLSIEDNNKEIAAKKEVFFNYIAPAVYHYNQTYTKNRLQMEDVVFPV